MSASIEDSSLIVLCLLSFTVTFSTIIDFTKFISDFSTGNDLSTSKYFDEGDSNSTVSYTTKAVITDLSLLSIFMIQHSSLLPLQDVISSAIQLPAVSRCILNIVTSASLQLLICCWKPIPHVVLWTLDQEAHFGLTWHHVFKGIHFVSWLMIYVMMIIMDVTDLFGIKQVYNCVTKRRSPSTLKSGQLRNLHQKVRHPSFVCFAAIFWMYPYMRLDRLILAIVWSCYMMMVWRPDKSDFNYLLKQQTLKKSTL